jgi:hypothetical protein
MKKHSRADYTYQIKEGVLQIIDWDRDPHAPSVTNDMFNVLQDIQYEGVDLTAQPIMYRDSRGFWDGVRVEHGHFLDRTALLSFGFFSLNEQEEEIARAKLKLLTKK